MPQFSFGNTFEATKGIRDVGFRRNTLETMSNPSTIVPRPMRRYEAIQWLMFADAFDECVSRGFVVATLDVKSIKPRFEDHGCEDCCPSLEKVDESLIGRELS